MSNASSYYNRLRSLESELLDRGGAVSADRPVTPQRRLLDTGVETSHRSWISPGWRREGAHREQWPSQPSDISSGNRLLGLAHHLDRGRVSASATPERVSPSVSSARRSVADNGFAAYVFDQGEHIQVGYRPKVSLPEDEVEDWADEAPDWTDQWDNHWDGDWEDDESEYWEPDEDLTEDEQSAWEEEEAEWEEDRPQPLTQRPQAAPGHPSAPGPTSKTPVQRNGQRPVTRTVVVDDVPAKSPSKPPAQRPATQTVTVKPIPVDDGAAPTTEASPPPPAARNGHAARAPKAIPRTRPPKAKGTTPPRPSAPRPPTPKANPAPSPARANGNNPHAAFGKLSQSLNHATAFNLGTVPVEIPFDDFDHRITQETTAQAQALEHRFKEFDRVLTRKPKTKPSERAPPS